VYSFGCLRLGQGKGQPKDTIAPGYLMIVESVSEANAQFVLPHALSVCSRCTCRWTWTAGRSELIRQAVRILHLESQA
jgi:hypothetical protein